MDPVSHVALGYAVIHLRRRRERGVVAAVALGALSPDIDVVLLPTGWDRYVVAHQAGTHSLIGAFVCGILAAALALAVRRGSSRGALVVAAVVGALSHLWFDLACGASIRLGSPFSDRAFSNLGLFAMADPVAAFIVALSALLVWRARERRQRRAIWMIVLFAAFLAVKGASRLGAEALFASAGRLPAERVAAAWGSITRWHLYARTPTSLEWWEADVVERSIRCRADVMLVEGDAVAARIAAASLQWETVRNFRRAHDLSFSTVTQSVLHPGGSRVMWSDLGYCDLGATDSLRCSVRVGGEITPDASRPYLIVEIGDFVQAR
jgi:membrane-bound metal-dependent hydrolase YbcI (DUF457 family)